MSPKWRRISFKLLNRQRIGWSDFGVAAIDVFATCGARMLADGVQMSPDRSNNQTDVLLNRFYA